MCGVSQEDPATVRAATYLVAAVINTEPEAATKPTRLIKLTAISTTFQNRTVSLPGARWQVLSFLLLNIARSVSGWRLAILYGVKIRR